MKYMLLIYGAEDAGPTPGTPAFDEQRRRWMTYTRRLEEAGAMLAGAPLQGAATATTVRSRNGDDLITDGPFAETKEVLGGYYLIDVADLDQALSWARQMPNIGFGSVEVRPVLEIPGM